MKWYYIVIIVVAAIAIGYGIKTWMDSSSAPVVTPPAGDVKK